MEKYIAGIILMIILPFASCKKGGCNVIPSYSFQSEAISITAHPRLAVNGGYDSIPGGVAGIYLVKYNGEILAFDRCSTVNPSERNAVETTDGLIATDPKSGAEYLLINGSPSKIAECPLKKYVVSKQGNIIYVIN
ncbi:hypothetical protein SAMN05216436_10873 [bacterium A37T11]|nr:hypothetical protein SAMN05216436_10873 [bacterium A37T11]